MSSLPRLGVRLHGGLPPARAVELAVAAEANGFASVWFAENPLERGALATLGACAAATRRIELGIGVWNPFLRHPAQIAMDIAALDELSQGRATLGLGSGLAAPIGRLGIDNRKTLAAMADSVAIVRGLLRGEPLTYKGNAFAVEDVKLSFKPLRADLAVLMAARGPKALALAGRVADGLMISNMCPPGFAVRAASIAKPTRTPYRIVQYVPCAVGPNKAQATVTMKPVLAGLLKTFWGLAQRVPAAHDSLVTHSGIPAADFASTSAGGDPDRRFLDAFTLSGDAGDIRRGLAAYRDAGVTDLVLTFVGPDPARDMAYLLRTANT